MTTGRHVDHREPPPPPTTTIHVVRLTMPHVRALGLLAALVAPGTLVGAAIAYRAWRRVRPQPSGRWVSAVVLAAIGGLFVPAIILFWPLRLLFGLLPPGGNIVVSTIGEAFCGPLLLQAVLHLTVIDRPPLGTARRKAGAGAGAGSAAEPSPARPSPSSPPPPLSWAHPEGAIRLGLDTFGGPFDLSLDELKQHIFIPGLPGVGKTTTLTRLVDGALTHGYGVVIVDCKGGSLRAAVERVARAHGRAAYIVSPTDPATYGYNSCTGSGASVANKIVGAFSFEGSAGVYGDMALGILAPVIDAMRTAGLAVTLESVYTMLDAKELTALRHHAELITNAKMIKTLQDIAAATGTLAAARDGLRGRLMAFLHGTFGEVLRREPALSWDEALAQSAVTYLELPTLGAEKDVSLLGRLVLQDLKEVAMNRLTAAVRGDTVRPILLIIDEFAALKEAAQINNLLLQGREAMISMVVATQYLPEDAALRKVVLGADVLLVHRVQAEDAEMIAKQVGTHHAMETTVTMDDAQDPQQGSGRGSTNVRRIERFNVDPQMLANLPRGQVAVRSVTRSESGWCGLVQVRKEIAGS